jgi:hypothetical protein
MFSESTLISSKKHHKTRIKFLILITFFDNTTEFILKKYKVLLN